MSNVDRREFLARLSAIGAAGALGAPSLAQAAGEDWRALVFLLLDGGIDGNALLIPTDAARFADYTRVRPTNAAVGLELSKLLPFTSAGDRFGLPPAAAGLHGLVASGEAAFVANTGPLLRATSIEEARAGANVPRSLFSHSDQVDLWQTLDYGQSGRTGVGGRLGDWVTQTYGQGRIPPIISFSTSAESFVASVRNVPVVASPQSNLNLGGWHLGPNGPWSELMQGLGRREMELNTARRSLRTIAAEDLAGSLAISAELGSIVQETTSLDSLFTGQWAFSDVARGLLKVAKLIQQRSRFGLKRQIFVVGAGSFDTHQGQDWQFQNLLTQIGNSLAAFQAAMKLMGVQNNVTTAAISDFGRTFRTNSTGGTDHGWGNHLFVVGPAVTTAGVYGQYPQLQLNGPDDLGLGGRWLPTTSSDQYVATLAKWFGVPDAAIPAIVPNIGSFSIKNLGFMKNV